MKHPLLLASLVAAALSSGVMLDSARADEREGTRAPRQDADSTAIRQGAVQSGTDGRNRQATGVVSDGEALGLLQAINEHEIAAAELAIRKDVGTPVMHYAQMLKKEHTANHSRTRVVSDESDINTFDSKDVEAMKAKGKSELEMLDALDGSTFEAAYIDAMVAGHIDALDRIDHQMLPASKDPAVQKHLRETREHIARHLAQAQRLDSDMQAPQ